VALADPDALRFLQPVGKGLALALGVFLLVGLVLPRGWRVERAVVIAGPPERISPWLSDLHRWQDWSVWTKAMDPSVRHAYWGPEQGVGAGWSWLGLTMGRGKVTITSADPRRGVTLDEAIESDQVNAHASLTLTPEAGGTRVTWVDEGELPLLGGYFRPRVEARLATHLEASLGRLKTVVEGGPADRPRQGTEPAPARSGP
jgi:Polyketide cyclase / dehydrase and lipid transport